MRGLQGGEDQNHSNQDICEKKYKTYFFTFTGNGTLVMCETLQWVGVGVGGSSLCLLSRNTSTRLIGKQSGGGRYRALMKLLQKISH